MTKDPYDFSRIKLPELVALYNRLKRIKPRTLDQQLLFISLEEHLWEIYRL